jgi:hypothetical protein
MKNILVNKGRNQKNMGGIILVNNIRKIEKM